MARSNNTSDGDEWIDVDDESDLLDSGEDHGLSPLERMVSDGMDGVAEMFDPESRDDPDDAD